MCVSSWQQMFHMRGSTIDYIYMRIYLSIKRNERELMRLLVNSCFGFVSLFFSIIENLFYTFERFVLCMYTAHRIDSTRGFTWMWQMSACILNSIFIECRCAGNAAPSDLHNFHAGPPFRYLYARVISRRIFAMRWLVIKITLRAGNIRQDCLVNWPHART